MKEIIEQVFKNYSFEVDYGAVYGAIASLIREYEYLKETYYRVRLDDKVGLSPSVTAMPGVMWFNHLFADNYFSYNLQHNEYHKNELKNFYKAVLFLDSNFYIDETWDLEKAKLLKKMLEDEDVIKMCSEIFDKTPKELVKESSYYYKDEVWEFVKTNKLLSYMKETQ